MKEAFVINVEGMGALYNGSAVTILGGSGSGKSTLLRKIVVQLVGEGKRVGLLSENTFSKLAEELQQEFGNTSLNLDELLGRVELLNVEYAVPALTYDSKGSHKIPTDTGSIEVQTPNPRLEGTFDHYDAIIIDDGFISREHAEAVRKGLNKLSKEKGLLTVITGQLSQNTVHSLKEADYNVSEVEEVKVFARKVASTSTDVFVTRNSTDGLMVCKLTENGKQESDWVGYNVLKTN